MQARDLELIDSFLVQVGKMSLLEYYGLDDSAPKPAAEAAIKKRRGWAQGQQANPKYRSEAMWLIKHNGLVRRALLDERKAYLDHCGSKHVDAGLAQLTPFLEGALAAGSLTESAEQAVREKADALGLPEHLVTAHIDRLVEAAGVTRQSAQQAGPDSSFVDFYALLDLPPSSSFEDIERAHRQKYRWARNLRDKQRAGAIYQELDQAWRVLKDPAHRRRYDADYARRKSEPEDGWTEDDAERNRPPQRDTSSEPTVRMKPLDASALSKGVGFAGVDAPSETRAPKPPENISKRTLGLSQGSSTRGKKRPRLAVASPELVQIKARRATVERRIVVKNTGRGRMPGRVASDRDWLEIDRARLDPDALEQEITVTIQPSRMPRSKSVALVTVVTDHGERRAITFRVERQPLAMPAFLVAGGIAAALLAAQLTGVLDQLPLGERAPDEVGSTALEVVVDPSADNIRVNGYTQAAGSFVRMESGFPIGTSFELSVEKEHFEPYSGDITVEPGKTRRVEISLQLGSVPVWDPPETAVAAEMDDRRAKASIAERGAKLEACFASAGVDVASLDVEVTVGNMGAVEGLRRLGSTEATPDDELWRCLARQLLAVQFQVLQGDYARFVQRISAGPS